MHALAQGSQGHFYNNICRWWHANIIALAIVVGKDMRDDDSSWTATHELWNNGALGLIMCRPH